MEKSIRRLKDTHFVLISILVLEILNSVNTANNVRHIYRLLNVYCEIFGTCSPYKLVPNILLVRPSPYELVPNISQYTFNNLFIIYL